MSSETEQIGVAALLLTCVQKVPNFNLVPHTSYPDIISVVCFSSSMEIPEWYHYNMTSSLKWPGSSVGIATELRAGRSGDRIPGGGARFSAPVQTGPDAHPAFCTMGTGLYWGYKVAGA
jgi:hypothetical protein